MVVARLPYGSELGIGFEREKSRSTSTKYVACTEVAVTVRGCTESLEFWLL
jgi:hypothetical protein